MTTYICGGCGRPSAHVDCVTCIHDPSPQMQIEQLQYDVERLSTALTFLLNHHQYEPKTPEGREDMHNWAYEVRALARY